MDESARILHLIFDKDFFKLLFSQIIAKEWFLFEEMLHAAETAEYGKFSHPILFFLIFFQFLSIFLIRYSFPKHESQNKSEIQFTAMEMG